jgi:NADPH:quinone reductase
VQAITVKNFGGPEVLELVDLPEPVPGPGEVLIQVEAIGVNPVETYIRAGTYPRLPALPYTPGGNVAGRVAACGPGVFGWQKGERVYSAATLSGGYAELALCSAEQIFALPESHSFAEGAAIGVPAATAWRGLYLRGGARAGERVLVRGASGSVGQAAVQLARAGGMKVYGTAGTDQGCAVVRALGAEVFNHTRQECEAELLATAGATGFDLILEMLANKNLDSDLSLLAPRGRVVIIGSRGRIEIDPRATMGKETEIRGLAVFSATREETIATHRGLAEAMAAGVLVPAVARELPLAEAAHAHHLVVGSGLCGKIILRPRSTARP